MNAKLEGWSKVRFCPILLEKKGRENGIASAGCDLFSSELRIPCRSRFSLPPFPFLRPAAVTTSPFASSFVL